MKRATVQQPIVFEGVGIHSGLVTEMRILPASSGQGIRFRRCDLDGAVVPVLPTAIDSALRATGLRSGDVRVLTPEHVLAALFGAGVSDCDIELSSEEVPILDGSAQPFLNSIMDSGIQLFPEEWRPIQIRKPIVLTHQSAVLSIYPSDWPIFEYHLSYPAPIGDQSFVLNLPELACFQTVAQARTFGFLNEYERLVASGLAKGASFENALVGMPNGEYSSPLRYPDEPVRHKVLDMVGDFSILGAPILGHVVGQRSGHALNLMAVMEISGLKSS